MNQNWKFIHQESEIQLGEDIKLLLKNWLNTILITIGSVDKYPVSYKQVYSYQKYRESGNNQHSPRDRQGKVNSKQSEQN